jgi:hypothetical protein
MVVSGSTLRRPVDRRQSSIRRWAGRTIGGYRQTHPHPERVGGGTTDTEAELAFIDREYKAALGRFEELVAELCSVTRKEFPDWVFRFYAVWIMLNQPSVVESKNDDGLRSVRDAVISEATRLVEGDSYTLRRRANAITSASEWDDLAAATFSSWLQSTREVLARCGFSAPPDTGGETEPMLQSAVDVSARIGEILSLIGDLAQKRRDALFRLQKQRAAERFSRIF